MASLRVQGRHFSSVCLNCLPVMKKGLWLIALSLCCLTAFAQSGIIDINGKQCAVDTIACYQVGPGTLYTRFNVKIGSQLHKLYLLTVDLTNPYITVEEGQGREHMGSVELMTATHQRIDSAGHRPIGSVNCNFWCVSSQNTGDWEGLVNQPFAGTAKDGMLIGEPMDWNAPHGDRGYVMLDAMKRVWIRNMEFNGRLIKGTASRKIFDCNRPRVTPTNPNEICLFNRYIGTTRALPDTAIEVVFLPIQGQEWAINDTMTCVVTSINHTGRSALTGQMGALQGRGTRGTWMQNNFQVGDTFRLLAGMYSANQIPGINVQYYSPDYNYSGDSITPQVMQMVTGNCLVMANGDLTYRNYNEDYNNKNYPRTVLATNNEGNRMWLLVSEKPGNYTAEMCAMLKLDGATWAAGMDGGGSAQMNLFGKILNPTTEANPRAVANSWFVVSTAPDDANVASLQFVDNLPTVISSYASYSPKMRGYNQYGWLLTSDFQDFTLTCEPASLGTISPDGKTFIASSTGGIGTLTAHFGNVSASKAVTVMAGEVSVRISNLLIDNREYLIEVVSTSGDKSYAVDPAMLSWAVADPTIVSVSEAGVMKGLKNGNTTVTGTLGESQTVMNVTVEIAEEEALSFENFEDTTLWRPESNYGDIFWEYIYGAPEYSTALFFNVNSLRSPQIKIVRDLALFSLPDSMELRLNTEVGLKKISFNVQAACDQTSSAVAFTPVVDTYGNVSVMLRPSDFGANPDDLATYPITLQSITFTLQNVQLSTLYQMAMHDIVLYYHNTQKTGLQDLPASDSSARKVLRDGMMLIEKDGVLYTLTGVQLRP